MFLSPSGWMVSKHDADVALPLQRLLFPWESFWQALESVFALGLLIAPYTVSSFRPDSAR